MTPNSTESNSPSSADTMANALKALGHPVRLKMLQQLHKFEKPCCGDICECFPHSQSTISQHLGVLVDAGLVCCNQDGNRSRYSINHTAYQKLLSDLVQFVPNSETVPH